MDHEHVVDRVIRVRKVTARDQSVIEGLAVLVRAVIVPEFAVGGVERFFQTYGARDHVAGDGGGRIYLAARPIRDGAGIAAARSYHFEVGVADEETLRRFDLFRIGGGRRIVAGGKHRRRERDREDQEHDQNGNSLSFHNVLYKKCDLT